MQVGNWTRLTWWQKTRLTAFGIAGLALIVAIILTVTTAVLGDPERLASATWLAFTAFPLLGVILIAALARIQQGIDVNAPPASKNEMPRETFER